MRADHDIVIVGMGSGGMVAAELAASLGLRVAAVERSRVGGDCLWTGCVPSKALLASARAAHTMRAGERYGLNAIEPEIDTGRVWERIRAVQRSIAQTDDDPKRYEDMGVPLRFGPARIVSPHEVRVGERRLGTRYILLCMGSRPAVPPIDGLPEAGYLTSESLFELPRAPRSMIVIGGGPIAIEMAQGLRRLGVDTTVLELADRLLARDEPELVDRLAGVMEGEGVELQVGVTSQRVTVEGGRKVVHAVQNGRSRCWEAQEILVAAGRRPDIDGLGLAELGVQLSARGVVVDDRQRSTVPSIYAAGDVAGRHLFTHSAAYEAVRAVRNMFLPGSATGEALVPWCTFTDPELAHAGLTVEQARARHGAGRVQVFRHDLEHSDRARAESATEGAVVLVTARGRLVGAHVLAPGAGEVIGELALAIDRGLKLTDLAGVIHVYPTISVAISQLAAEAAYASARRYRWLVPVGRAAARLSGRSR